MVYLILLGIILLHLLILFAHKMHADEIKSLIEQNKFYIERLEKNIYQGADPPGSRLNLPPSFLRNKKPIIRHKKSLLTRLREFFF